MSELRHLLASIPPVPALERAPAVDAALAGAVVALGSAQALASIASDPYWPKWDAPWWQMVLLWELGEARQIPERVVAKMVDALNAMPLKFLPLRPEDAPGANFARDCPCHCALGSMYQVLTACGVEVDAALPWIKPWFVRYQMADGGLNCNGAAYLVTDECPSSMVGTIAAFEAMLLGSWTAEQRGFVDRAAGFLIERELRLGSPTVHNAEERVAAAGWLLPCFPRFYFYDVLRGLVALVRWAELTGRSIPRRAVAPVIEHLVAAFPDGVIRLGRHGFAICPTGLRQDADGAWVGMPTQRSPLIDVTCAIGLPSPVLTQQWSATRRALNELLDRGRITD